MLTIYVTQDDIDKGTRGDGASCPVAIAIERRCPGMVDVEVDDGSIEIDGDADDFYYHLTPPAITGEFIRRFDEQGPSGVLPFSFELDLPEAYFHPEPSKVTWQDLKPNTPYKVEHKTTGNGKKSKPHKSKFHGRTVVIKENNPSNTDIPSFEHGWVHLYDATTNEYLGASGIFYFARSVGMMGI